MLGILSRRLFVLVVIMVLVSVLAGSFINELAIINGAAIQTAFIADFLRYSLALLALLMIATSVAEDYEFRQFERLLTMPLARWQYIAAQTLVIACLCLFLTLPVALLISLYGNAEVGLYWAVALWLELFLLGVLGTTGDSESRKNTAGGHFFACNILARQIFEPDTPDADGVGQAFGRQCH